MSTELPTLPVPVEESRVLRARAPLSLRRRLTRVGVGLVSLGVVMAMAAFVFVTPTPRVDLTVREISEALPYEVDLTPEYSLVSAETARKARFREVLYGSVRAVQGVPVSQVVITLTGQGRKLRGQRATIRVPRPTSYRAILRLKPGRYKVALSLRVAGKSRGDSATVTLRNGRSYFVGARISESGLVTLLPISSY